LLDDRKSADQDASRIVQALTVANLLPQTQFVRNARVPTPEGSSGRPKRYDESPCAPEAVVDKYEGNEQYQEQEQLHGASHALS
jgi:hypothetical protein